MPAVHRAAADLELACANGAGDEDVQALTREVSHHLSPVIAQLKAL
jgi:hypothetical protein